MNFRAWKRYARYYGNSRARLAGAVTLSVLQALLVLPITWLVRFTFDKALPAGDFRQLASVALALLALSIGGNALTLWTRSLILRTTKRAIAELRADLIERCYELPRSFYDSADKSHVHGAIVQDTERVDVMSNGLIAQLLPAVVTAAALCVVLVFINPLLFLVLLLVAPLLWLFSRRLSFHTGSAARQFQRSFETFSSGVANVFQLMDLTRAQTAEDSEVERQRSGIDHLRITSAKTAWMEAAYGMMHGSVTAISAALILVVGGLAISAGRMTVGQLLSFYVAIGLLNAALGTSFSSVPSIISGNESLTTLLRFLESDSRLPYSGTRQIKFTGEIVLDSVSFGYDEKSVIDNVSLAISPGTIVAIIGANGSGKTTIAHLILGFYRPQRGQLYADGVAFDDVDIRAMREGIGVVMQDTVMFAGTVGENIAYGCPGATQLEIEHAAELATAADFVRDLPQGFDSQVGENGVMLSGGHRQRIAIARALLRPARLLILDEPTNHLDSESVTQLVSNLGNLADPPAILLITHDMDLASIADQTHVLRDGVCLGYELA
jgi:ABC-type multidrug transport system fused ATPase/permease subunit